MAAPEGRIFGRPGDRHALKPNPGPAAPLSPIPCAFKISSRFLPNPRKGITGIIVENSDIACANPFRLAHFARGLARLLLLTPTPYATIFLQVADVPAEGRCVVSSFSSAATVMVINGSDLEPDRFKTQMASAAGASALSAVFGRLCKLIGAIC